MTATLDRPTDVEPAQPQGRRVKRDHVLLVVLLLATAGLYLWNLGASGWANGFYSAAVQAGSHSWKAFFFGSFDSSNFITVDKPPASLWVMDLSARLFGVNAWSILVPQALEGVAAVALLYAAVRRRFGPTSGLLAGAVLATTPVAALMFRFDNPDALLTLLLVGSAYAVVRALEGAHTRWLVIAGTCIGMAFLTKMLQAFLVVPGFGAVYLLAAPTTLVRRIRQLAIATVAIVVSAGWWIVAVMLTPASSRPYIGGSQHNSVLELVIGYNGLGRLTGQETGSVGGAATQSGRWGATGITRLFNAEFGGQVAWLIPAALVLLAVTLWLTRRRPRTDPHRTQLLLWGSWLAVTGLTFSLAKGIIHPYYSVALAPAIGALVGIGAVATWRARAVGVARIGLATAVTVTALTSWALLDRSPSWHPVLRGLVLVVGLAAAAGIVAAPWLRGRLAAAVAVAALLAGLAGPAAYAVETASQPESGAIPSAGPAVAGGTRGPGGFGRPGGAPPGGFTRPTGGRLGGLLDTSTPDAAVVAALQAGAGRYRWVAATIGSNNAAGLQLASGQPVMSIGGFNGTDPTPTLAQFVALVQAGKIHYFVAGGGMGGGPGGFGGQGGTTSTGSLITSWVEQHYQSTTIGGMTVYDLAVS